ncbi:MAG: translesion error-prone DNA polymerase V autoproteolytic subunit [Massilibacteroides sp.]|nr:translesion error-prone DNA polymerase V autoproteolytic subunit [Massilibacteroides sp.]
MSIDIHKIDLKNLLPLPLAGESIQAGFPSPATDYMEMAIDLNKELIRHPATTFYGRVVGDSMKDVGIEAGDLLVIDKSLTLRDGDMAVCFIDGEFTLKFVHLEKDIVWLQPANEAYPAIKVTQYNNFMIWGIVTYTIKKRR